MKHLLLILSTLLIFACKKNDNSSQKPKDLLINKKWQISAQWGQYISGAAIPDIYPLRRDYQKDDYFFFKSDFTYELN